MAKKEETTRLTKDGEKIGIMLAGGQAVGGKVESETDTTITIRDDNDLKTTVLAQGIVAIWYPPDNKKEANKNV
jgi:hypothetical protein